MLGSKSGPPGDVPGMSSGIGRGRRASAELDKGYRLVLKAFCAGSKAGHGR